MVPRFGLYARSNKELLREVVKIITKVPKRIVKSFKRTLSYRQKIKQTFNQDSLICPHCQKEMELFRIWHPKYAEIYYLPKDGFSSPPEVGRIKDYEKRRKTKDWRSSRILPAHPLPRTSLRKKYQKRGESFLRNP